MLQWILPEHGPAGRLVEAFDVAAHDIDDLIDNLSATMVSKEAYNAMEAVHRDFTCDDPNKIEVVTEALVSVLGRYSSKYDPPSVPVELHAPDHREATIPTPPAPPTPVGAPQLPTESGPAQKRRRLDDNQTPRASCISAVFRPQDAKHSGHHQEDLPGEKFDTWSDGYRH